MTIWLRMQKMCKMKISITLQIVVGSRLCEANHVHYKMGEINEISKP
jgi:hypothetical protein